LTRAEEGDLTRAEIIQLLHDRLAISRKDAKEILERFLDVLAKCLEDGERIVLSGLGSFQVRPTPARPGRNPKTGKVANVPAKNRPSFAMSQSLRAAMAEWQSEHGSPGQGEPPEDDA
jgi:nucleoid DNA-binding protein